MNIKNRNSKYFSKAANKFYVGGSISTKMSKKTQSMPFTVCKSKARTKNENLPSRVQNFAIDKSLTQNSTKVYEKAKPRRDHSVSQGYQNVHSAITRPRYDSVSSLRSERPSFKKLEQITCTDYADTLSPERSPEPIKQRPYSQHARISRKLCKQYKSCTEQTRFSTTNDVKWNQALKKQK